MPRSKNAVASRAKRKKILAQAKGFYGKRKNVYWLSLLGEYLVILFL